MTRMPGRSGHDEPRPVAAAAIPGWGPTRRSPIERKIKFSTRRHWHGAGADWADRSGWAVTLTRLLESLRRYYYYFSNDAKNRVWFR